MKRGLIPGIIVALVLRAPVSPLSDGRVPAVMSRLGDVWTEQQQIDAAGVSPAAQHRVEERREVSPLDAQAFLPPHTTSSHTGYRRYF
jgi:hypothetical protein